MALGITGFVMNVNTALVQIACNTQLRRYGGDIYVGAMTVINSVKEIAFLDLHGITGGAQPVLGYNYGAKAYGACAPASASSSSARWSIPARSG